MTSLFSSFGEHCFGSCQCHGIWWHVKEVAA